MKTITPPPGFDWSRVAWRALDQLGDSCGYCGASIPDAPAWLLFREQGRCTRLCTACRSLWIEGNTRDA